MRDAREAAGPTQELDIDYFAGGGGVSMGFENATGKAMDLAVNHCPLAIAMHAANHPNTRHLTEDVWKVDIEAETLPVCREQGMGVVAFSPLAGGLLSDRYLEGIPADSRAASASPWLLKYPAARR